MIQVPVVCILSFAEEISQISSRLSEAELGRQSLRNELEMLRVELDDIKTATVISETGRQDEVQTLRRKYAEEMASLQLLMKGTGIDPCGMKVFSDVSNVVNRSFAPRIHSASV